MNRPVVHLKVEELDEFAKTVKEKYPDGAIIFLDDIASAKPPKSKKQQKIDDILFKGRHYKPICILPEWPFI